MRRSVALCTLVLAFSATAAHADPTMAPTGIDLAESRAAKEPLDALLKDVDHAHPAAMFILAKRLLDAGRKDDAVFWFYEGQLRWRALMLTSNPDVEPIVNGEQDHFKVLFADIGPDINYYAHGDIPGLLKTIDRVLAWDASHPDDFTPAGKTKDAVRSELTKYETWILAHQDAIKASRAEHDRIAQINASPDDPYSGSGGMMTGTPAVMLADYDAQKFSAFHVGATAKGDVVKTLGKPEWWLTDKDRSTTIGYSYNKRSAAAATRSAVERVTVNFKFDAKQILTAIDLPKDKAP